MKLFELSQLAPRSSVRFEVAPGREGFAIRVKDGSIRAYLNVCPHRAQPVDWGDGRLFLLNGDLECPAHGARFDPSTGVCKFGPCEGSSLTRLQIEERDGAIFLVEGAI
jgi:nitrite reductase/ring-hydroxylating ferredoxin subunit